MISNAEIERFIYSNNYDIRKTNNSRWFDQKCTPDVLSIVADCVINFKDENPDKSQFSSGDIWRSDYTREYVEEIFSKPGTNHEKTSNEYDKFFSQPLELLASSKILNKLKVGNRNYYTVSNYGILEYISLREKNAIEFLYFYIKKVLTDSGLWDSFEYFFAEQTQDSYFKVKTTYENFIIDFTKINNLKEVRRIFTKVINPLAYKYRKLGTHRGRISKQRITYASLMYNQENFRDLFSEKPKNLTRQEWREQKGITINVDYYKYQAIKAKKQLRIYNDEKRNGLSEIEDEYNQGKATQVHHIFPQSQYIEISSYLENLICLTPTQHFYKAHPNNNTQLIDYEYQEMLLKAKTNIIQEDIEAFGTNSIYEFEQLVEVINKGFEKNYEVEDKNFTEIMNIINVSYQDI